MNAKEARELTITKLKGYNALKAGIESMANGGYFFASYPLEEIHEPEKRKNELESEEFIVIISTNNFKVTW